MELTLKTGKTIKVGAFPASIHSPWEPSGKSYIVTVTVNKKTRRFPFWDSIHNMQNGIPCDVRGALACFGSDAMSGENAHAAADIMSEFGYTDPKEARRVFKGLKRAQQQAAELSLTWDELAELADY